MKTILTTCLLLGIFGVAKLEAQTMDTPLRLSGILNLPGTKRAILEFSSIQGAGYMILAEGQREGDIDLLEIHPESATVKANRRGVIVSLTLTDSHERTQQDSSGIILDNAALEPVLVLYGELSERTLLRWQPLPKLSFTVHASSASPGSVAEVLMQALIEKELAVIPDGERFIMIVPKAQAARATPRSAEIKQSSAQPALELLPPGTINFPNTSIAQVIQIYAELVGRSLDRGSPLPFAENGSIQFKNQTPLTKAEAVYALDRVLGWAGVKMVSIDAHLIKPAPVSIGDH